MNQETIRQLFIKPSRRSLVTEKNDEKVKKIQKTCKKLQIILKIADLKILKNLSLHLEHMQ